MVGIRAQLEIARKTIEAHITLLLLRPMAPDTVFFEESLIRLRRANGVGKAKAGHEN